VQLSKTVPTPSLRGAASVPNVPQIVCNRPLSRRSVPDILSGDRAGHVFCNLFVLPAQRPAPAWGRDMVIVVIGIMVAAGLAGATAGLALSAERPTWSRWRLSAVAGIGAALLVPLFLRTVSSNLLPAILGGRAAPDDLFVFAGFCLLAAIASRRFIEALSDRLLREAREAKQRPHAPPAEER